MSHHRREGVPSAAHRLPRLLAGTLAVPALGATAPAEASAPAAPAAAREGASRNGRNPRTAGCDEDAVTPSGAVARSAGGGPGVQSRYSKKRDAVWARSGSAANDAWRGEPDIGNGKPYVFHASPDHAACSVMVNAGLAARPCVEHHDGAGGSRACTRRWYQAVRFPYGPGAVSRRA